MTPQPSNLAPPRGIRAPFTKQFHPLDYVPPPLTLSIEARSALDALLPREAVAGDPPCQCCGEPVSPEGLALLAS